MPEPIKIRAVQQGESTEIRILLQHPMETGLRRDQASGQKIPAHFITTFTVSAHGKVLINAQLNTSIARKYLDCAQSAVRLPEQGTPTGRSRARRMVGQPGRAARR